MKKLLSFIFLIMLSVGLNGCGNKSESSEIPISNTPALVQEGKIQKLPKIQSSPAHVENNMSYGYITAYDVLLRQEPSTSAQILDAMNKGQRLEIKGTVGQGSGQWYKVKHPNGKIGYVFGKYVSMNIEDGRADIPVPPGYKVHETGKDYITCYYDGPSDNLGHLGKIYDAQNMSACFSIKEQCNVGRLPGSGTEGETVTIYRNGDVKVVTNNATKLTRFYTKKGFGINNNTLHMVYFTLSWGNNLYKWNLAPTNTRCSCGRIHRSLDGFAFVLQNN